MIQTINNAGVTVLLVEQNAQMALSIADRAYVLETGEVKLAGQSAELAADQLLRSGCRRFGWLNTHPSTWAGRMRGEAFSRALQTRGVNIERDLAHLACPEEGYVGGEQAAALAGRGCRRERHEQ